MPRRSTTALVCSALVLSPIAVLSAHSALAAGDDAAPAPSSSSSAPRTPHSVKFASNSFFTQPITDAPLAANSDAQAAELAKQVNAHFGGVAAFNVWDWNVGFAKATADTPKTNVEWVDCQGKGYQPPDIHSGSAYFKNVPIPANAVPAVGGDGHLTVYDPTSDKLWEFWQAKHTDNGWQACWGGRIDNVSENPGQFKEGYGSSAVNTAMAGSMISIDEVRSGQINHAIGLAIPEPAPYDQFSWPAQRSDGPAGSKSPILEGTRLRLDPNLNLDQYNLTPIGRMIAEAAQKYGFFIDNKAGAVSVSTESGLTAQKETGVNPWKELLGDSENYQVLKNFPWDKTQFLPKDYGKSSVKSASTPSASSQADHNN